MENLVPNLDDMTPDLLMQVWKRHDRGRNGKYLFPNRPKGYRVQTNLIAHYAANKATAIKERTAGRIQCAIMYEKICDNIYEKLQDWARW